MNIVHSVTGTQWSILKCYKHCRCAWVACTKMLVFISISPPVRNHLVFSPLALSDWAAKKRVIVQPVCIEIYRVRFTVLSCVVYSLTCSGDRAS